MDNRRDSRTAGCSRPAVECRDGTELCRPQGHGTTFAQTRNHRLHRPHPSARIQPARRRRALHRGLHGRYHALRQKIGSGRQQKRPATQENHYRGRISGRGKNLSLYSARRGTQHRAAHLPTGQRHHQTEELHEAGLPRPADFRLALHVPQRRGRHPLPGSQFRKYGVRRTRHPERRTRYRRGNHHDGYRLHVVPRHQRLHGPQPLHRPAHRGRRPDSPERHTHRYAAFGPLHAGIPDGRRQLGGHGRYSRQRPLRCSARTFDALHPYARLLRPLTRYGRRTPAPQCDSGFRRHHQ